MRVTARRNAARGATSWRLALALAWLGAIAATSLAALVNRPHDVSVQSSAWIFLVLLSAPGVVIAVDFIRTPAILGMTTALAVASSIGGSWATLRDTHSTAAIGVLTVPMFATALVGVGCLADFVWRSRLRRNQTDA